MRLRGDNAGRGRGADAHQPSRACGHRRARSLVRLTAVVVAGLGMGFVGLNVLVTRTADGLGFDDPATIPSRPVAIVFGAGVINGKPTSALEDRIGAAVTLFHTGRVSHLLMSGDNSSADYDEVTVMRDVAVRGGVPRSAISRDHAGFNTYDSCARARTIFGVRAAVLVTQDYHLSRALYTCRANGIDAVGFRVPDWQHRSDRLSFAYPEDLQRSYMTREWIARAKAVIDTRVRRPSPRFLGRYEGLGEP